MANRDGSESKQLTADAFIDQQPSVSGDGRYIVFQSNRSGAGTSGESISTAAIRNNSPKAIMLIRLRSVRLMDAL